MHRECERAHARAGEQIIFLNVIFGVIVDTFGDLRDKNKVPRGRDVVAHARGRRGRTRAGGRRGDGREPYEPRAVRRTRRRT